MSTKLSNKLKTSMKSSRDIVISPSTSALNFLLLNLSSLSILAAIKRIIKNPGMNHPTSHISYREHSLDFSYRTVGKF